MNTIVVFTLVVWMGSPELGAPMIIDNIASAEACQAMRVNLERDFQNSQKYNATYYAKPFVVRSRCYAIRKVK